MAAIQNASEKEYKKAIEVHPDLVNLDRPELFIKILRFLMFVLVVALGCIGYNIYEDTLAAVWIPVGVGLVVAVVTLPLYKKWIWLTTMEQKAVNILCHVVCVGVISCSLFLVGNYQMAAPASTKIFHVPNL